MSIPQPYRPNRHSERVFTSAGDGVGSGSPLHDMGALKLPYSPQQRFSAGGKSGLLAPSASDAAADATWHPLPSRMDATNSAAIGTAIGERIKGIGQTLILDASAMEYISSRGVHTLWELRMALDHRRSSLVIAAPQRFVREVLILGGLEDLLRPVSGA